MKKWLNFSFTFLSSLLWTGGYILSLTPIAGNFIKRNFFKKIVEKYAIPSFVETGTFRGGTAKFMSYRCKEVYSVELDDTLYANNVKHFANKKNMHLYHGDSSTKLVEMLNDSDSKKCLVFLDGHYSGLGTAKGNKECPLIEELEILHQVKNKDIYIIIDDIRLFGVDSHYPTLGEIINILISFDKGYKISIQHDMLLAVT